MHSKATFVVRDSGFSVRGSSLGVRRSWFGVLATAAVVLITAVVGRAEIIEQILVKVNGEIFTKSDLEQRQVAAIRAQNRNIKLEDAKGDSELRKALDEVTPQVL